jgi:kynurenine formamidase
MNRKNPRWNQRPERSTWGDFGEDDQLGRLNLLTPQKVLEGIQEVRVGQAFSLSLPLDFPGGSVLKPGRNPPKLQPTEFQGCPCMNFPLQRMDGRNVDIVSDDQVTMSLQYSTQWDAFSHVGAYFDVEGNGKAEKVYYNGYRANQHVNGPFDYEVNENGEAENRPLEGPFGARALSISNFAVKGIQGRAVMFDLKRHFGLTRQTIGYKEIQTVIEKDQIDVRPGDMVLFRTGFTEVLLEMNRNPDKEKLDTIGCELDGRDPDLLRWITDSQIAALCADNYAVESLPARQALGRRPALPLHHHCLFKLGVPLAELWFLKDLADWLAAHKRTAFLLTAPPLHLPGAVGSPVTPIATV